MGIDDRLKQAEGKVGSNDFESLDHELDHYQAIMDDFETSGLLPNYKALRLRELEPDALERFLIHARAARERSQRLGGEPLAVCIDNRCTTDDLYELLSACRRRLDAEKRGDISKQT